MDTYHKTELCTTVQHRSLELLEYSKDSPQSEEISNCIQPRDGAPTTKELTKHTKSFSGKGQTVQTSKYFSGGNYLAKTDKL